MERKSAEENKTQFIDHEGTRYWYEYRLAKDRVDICLGTTDPKKYCNGTYLYSTKDPGDGMAFVIIKSEPVDSAFQKEQFETQQSVHYWAGRLIGHENAYDIAQEIVEAIGYASQQCEEMKIENERLIDRLNRIEAATTHDTYVIGKDPKTKKVVFMKTYIYEIQETEAQRDLKQVIDSGIDWSIGAIECLKIAHEDIDEPEEKY